MIIAGRIDALRPTLFSSIKYRFRHSGHLLRTRPGTSHLCLCIVRVRVLTTYRRSIFKSSIAASIVIIHITDATNHNLCCVQRVFCISVNTAIANIYISVDLSISAFSIFPFLFIPYLFTLHLLYLDKTIYFLLYLRF